MGVAGATSATLTSSGTGTFSQNVITNTGAIAIRYQPSIADATVGSVTLTLTSSDPDGSGACVADQVVRVLTINAVPGVSARSASICSSGVAELEASGASTYVWSNGATTQSISVSVAGTYSVTGVSAQGCSNVASGTLTVYPALALSPSSLPDAQVGAAYSQTITVTGGSPAYTFAAVGTLPGGLLLNASTGVISGTPISGGVNSFTVQVTDSKSCSALLPLFISVGATPELAIRKLVSRNRAKVGDLLSYTLILTNTGTASATSVVVSDTFSAALTYLPGSASASVGDYSPAGQGGTWTVASLPVNATATLVYSLSVTGNGVVTNRALVNGDLNTNATVCTSVPYQVCKGVPFAFLLSAPTGYSRYQWYLTTPAGTTLVSDVVATSANAATAGNFTATVAGEYSVVVNEGTPGNCADGSCCPVIVEEVEIPSYTVVTRQPTCTGITPIANGQLTLANPGADLAQYVYQISAGSSFSAATATPVNPAIVPANGILGSTFDQGTYTVRVWLLINGEPSCPRDVTVTLTANCACPEEICVPIIVKKTKSRGKTLP